MRVRTLGTPLASSAGALTRRAFRARLRTLAVALTLVPAASSAGGRDRSAAAEPPILGVGGASGVHRHGDQLLLVGDMEPSTYYTLPVTDAADAGFLPLTQEKLTRHHLAAGLAASSLESVDVLADGRVVALSAQFPGLFDERGLVVEYPQRLATFGGCGLEGVAVQAQADGSSRVAVLWAGGYPEADSLSAELRADPSARRAFHSRVFIHRLPRDASSYALTKDDVEAEVELSSVLPPGKEPYAQRYGANDLVWHDVSVDGKTQAGWIVLLTSRWGEKPAIGSSEECRKSERGQPLRNCARILQRYSADGHVVGDLFDLDDVLPAPIRAANWKGLAWLVPGKKLVLVYGEPLADKRLDPQEAFVVDLPAGW